MALITEVALRAMLAQGIPNPFPINEGDKLTPAAADFLKTRGIALIRKQLNNETETKSIPVGVSSRHVHLTTEDVELLFGEGHTLVPLRELSQKGQFAAQETVTLSGPKGKIENVRVLGPARKNSQVEISRTDGFHMGVHPPLRLSGHIEGTPGITLIGPKGSKVLQQGLIIAKNHVHMSPEEAAYFQVNDHDRIVLQAEGERPLFFADVTIRVSPQFSLDFHIDTDEANAALLKTGDSVKLVGKIEPDSGLVRV